MDYVREAKRHLDEADRIANTDSRVYDNEPGSRQAVVANYLARAQVCATLALAQTAAERA